MQYNLTAELNSYQNRLVKQYHQQKPMFCIQIIIIIIIILIIKQRLSFEDIFRLSISQIKNINKKQAIYKYGINCVITFDVRRKQLLILGDLCFFSSPVVLRVDLACFRR